MDGNGRWAEAQGLSRVEGHRIGADIAKVIIQECVRKNIPILSLFAFGAENWSRPIDEVEFLMQLFITSLEREMKSLHDNGVSIRFLGDHSRLSTALRMKIKEAEDLTQMNQTLILNIAVSYSGRWDIMQATKSLIAKALQNELDVNDLDEKQFSLALSTGDLPEPDLFIRTSGEQRISNFFLWQLAYTELYFTNIKWPEFNADEFERAIQFYSSRERRFGLTSGQLMNKEGDV